MFGELQVHFEFTLPVANQTICIFDGSEVDAICFRTLRININGLKEFIRFSHSVL